jgi:hypothetical protein
MGERFSAVSDATGFWRIDGLAPGLARLSLAGGSLAPGESVTTNNVPQDLMVSPQGAVSANSIGIGVPVAPVPPPPLGPGDVWGFVFSDGDEDGDFAGEDQPREDVRILVQDADGDFYVADATGFDGLWSVTGLAPGDATVSVLVPPDDSVVTTGNDPHVVTVLSEQTVQAEDIGFFIDAGGPQA